MVSKYRGVCSRLIEKLIKKVEDFDPSSSDESSSPASSSSDIDVVANQREYVSMKLKIKKECSFVCMVFKKNVNNNYPS